jgi:hypothetical protein
MDREFRSNGNPPDWLEGWVDEPVFVAEPVLVAEPVFVDEPVFVQEWGDWPVVESHRDRVLDGECGRMVYNRLVTSRDSYDDVARESHDDVVRLLDMLRGQFEAHIASFDSSETASYEDYVMREAYRFCMEYISGNEELTVSFLLEPIMHDGVVGENSAENLQSTLMGLVLDHVGTICDDICLASFTDVPDIDWAVWDLDIQFCFPLIYPVG